ncbi:hypothetical protein CRE_12016 [Caenorhabditis remanei]|uniref:F-box domain-containing protein n=1 Tax=Caenorhabditis remanei TaxID=31234 RepID=E3MPR9_CAERE|nr:hypothetical protein CRE_12016 [Caenorhabditis remanei]
MVAPSNDAGIKKKRARPLSLPQLLFFLNFFPSATMINSRPLSYESLKTVLKYIDPNKRFLLSARCPSIRSADKATPLIIDTFDYDENCFEVNRTVYKIGICKKYLNGAEIPPKARNHNAQGGLSYDLDQYGFKDLSGENTLTPGDVDLRKPNDEAWRTRNMREDNQIAEYEQALADTRSRLRTANGEPYIERLEYTKKLHEAVKYLTGKLLGNRLHPVAIGRFRVYDEVMRFPVGLRLDVQSLSVSNIQIVQESLTPLLTRTVKTLNVEVKSAGDFECAMLKNAEILNLEDAGSGFIRPPMVLNLTNLKANIIIVRWTIEDFMTVVRWWVEVVKKEVGTSYKFIAMQDKSIIHLIESIKEQYEEAKEIGELSLAIPTKYGSSINVSMSELESSFNKDAYNIKFTVDPDLPV